MASILDVSISSDSEDDVDYVPTGKVSASESSGDEDISDEELAPAKPKRAKKQKTVKSKKEDAVKDVSPAIDSKELNADPKKHADDIWKSFLSDVESSSVSKSITKASVVVDKSKSVEEVIPAKSECKDSKVPDKEVVPAKEVFPVKEVVPVKQEVPVKEVFEFAGETFTVDNDSHLAPHKCCGLSEANAITSATASETKVLPMKRGGIDSVLGTLMNKKQKMTTLQKTLYDWKTFKKSEGIEEDLEKFNKGKGGFIERQRFLQRSDVRSFEAEKNVRQSKKKK